MAMASNDFAGEIECLKLLTMMVIVLSCNYEKGVFQKSNELDPKKFLNGSCAPEPQNYTRLGCIHIAQSVESV